MDTADSLTFSPHVVLPVQFHSPRTLCPEQRLMLAILEDALSLYRKYGKYGRGSGRQWRMVAETEEWLFSDDTSWPFSFVNLCHALDIDVARVRAQIRHRPSPTAGVDVLPLAAAAS
jgi:hypothetical protein